MKRIAVVIDPWDFPFNGTVVSTRRFIHALQHEFDFTLLATPGQFEATDARMVAFKQLSIPGFNTIINAMKAPLASPDRRLLRQALAGCDLLHVQFPFFLGASAISVARELGLPVVCSFHVQPENVLRNVGIRSKTLAWLLYKLFVARIYNLADHVITPSQFARTLLRDNGLLRPATVLSNGVPEVFFSLPLERAANDRFMLLSVGRLAGEKRHDVIMEAIARCRHREHVTLQIAGAGPKEVRLRTKARMLGIDANIGTVSDEALIALYSRADLFIHAGEVELEGMSVLEAMASGNVVLLSDASGSAATELVRDARARFDNRNADELAGKIDDWLDDAPGRSVAARANRRIAAERAHDFSVARLSCLYRELLGEPR